MQITSVRTVAVSRMKTKTVQVPNRIADPRTKAVCWKLAPSIFSTNSNGDPAVGLCLYLSVLSGMSNFVMHRRGFPGLGCSCSYDSDCGKPSATASCRRRSRKDRLHTVQLLRFPLTAIVYNTTNGKALPRLEGSCQVSNVADDSGSTPAVQVALSTHIDPVRTTVKLVT
jgi:hypothetical protein